MESTVVCVLVLIIIVGGFAFRKLFKALDGYALEKGKNQATKEDLAQLTKIVEDIKQQNSVLLEDRKATHQLRMAAIDKRLQAHQEAYALWRELVRLAFGDPRLLGEKVMESQAWWDRNCLYLEPAARDAFFSAFVCVGDQKGYREARLPVEILMTNWSAVKHAGEAIVNAVQLPPLAIDTAPDHPASS